MLTAILNPEDQAWQALWQLILDRCADGFGCYYLWTPVDDYIGKFSIVRESRRPGLRARFMEHLRAILCIGAQAEINR